MRRLSPLVGALLVAACGTHGAGGNAAATPTSSAARAAATPAPSSTSTPLIAVLRGGRVFLVDLEGRDVASEPGQVLQPAGAGGDRAAWIGQDGVLRAMGRNGRIEQLEKLSRTAQAALSPDGSRWLWSDGRFDAARSSWQSVLHLGGPVSEDRVVEQVTETGRALMPYRWDSAGAVAWLAPGGVGGYIPFYVAFGKAELVDVRNARIGRELAVPEGCGLTARAADGTAACETISASGVTLWLLRPDGSSTSIPLSRPRFNLAGNVSFRPGPVATLAAVGGAVGDSQHEVYSTDLVSVSAGTIRRFGPDGIAPAAGDWAWLEDGSLLGYGAAATPGELDVYIVAPDGRARKVTSGWPIGVLNG